MAAERRLPREPVSQELVLPVPTPNCQILESGPAREWPSSRSATPTAAPLTSQAGEAAGEAAGEGRRWASWTELGSSGANAGSHVCVEAVVR